MERFSDTDTFRRWLIGHLRRISYRFGPRYRVKKAANKGRGLYECAICGETKKSKEVQLDHINPIIDPEQGFVDWNTFISRLFVDEEGWQAACKTCHGEKSAAENRVRRARASGKKEVKKRASRKKNKSKVQRAGKKKKAKVGSKRK